MTAIVYGNNCGFRSSGERRQFQRFRKVLPGDHILDNNFYIFQKKPLRLWEIDFCIISKEQVCLIEHKNSPYYLNNMAYKVHGIPRRLLDSLEEYDDISEEELPFVSSALIVDRPWKSQKLSDPLFHCVNSKENQDTELFLKEVFRRTPRKRTEFELEKVYELVTKRKPKHRPEKGITKKTFEVFDEISEYADKTENGETIPEDDVEDLIRKQIERGATLHHYASDILNEIDENRQEKGYPSFFLHRPGIGYLRKFRPVYFVAMTESEEDDSTSHFQLAFHVGRGDKFKLSQVVSSTGLQDSRLQHLAVKLAIFANMDANRLSALIERLRDTKEKERFRKLILSLNENSCNETDPFYFIESKKHYKNPNIALIDQKVADNFMRILDDYNRPECRSRDIGFVKFFFYEKPEVKELFKKKTSAIGTLKEALRDLLPLYDFMMGHS